MVRHKVVQGDCVEILKKEKRQFDMVFCDPPFNVGQPYQNYVDRMERDAFQKFTLAWIKAAWSKCKGVMCLHGPDELVKEYLGWEFTLGMTRIAWVIWHYRFGQCNRHNWINSHAHCLIYAKDPKNYTWNPEEVLVESDRSSTYGDPRVHQTVRGGSRVPFTVWGIPSDGPYWGRVQGNSGERRNNHPNQLPEKYLERLIRAYTNPGDYCLDPFGGSGTSAVVALALGRNVMTCDISEASCASIRDRIKQGAVRISKEN